MEKSSNVTAWTDAIYNNKNVKKKPNLSFKIHGILNIRYDKKLKQQQETFDR